jgi:hypothetical protein
MSTTLNTGAPWGIYGQLAGPLSCRKPSFLPSCSCGWLSWPVRGWKNKSPSSKSPLSTCSPMPSACHGVSASLAPHGGQLFSNGRVAVVEFARRPDRRYQAFKITVPPSSSLQNRCSHRTVSSQLSCSILPGRPARPQIKCEYAIPRLLSCGPPLTLGLP